MTDPVPRYSIVLPVYNEGANITATCGELLGHAPGDYELLVCYDFEEDDTLPALAATPDDRKPHNIRLVRNELGKGVRYAIEAGMRAATAPVVVVMMADLSDDLEVLGRMVEQCEGGAAVVCASRYMPGGRQIGGPLIKRILSRVAGVTLRWLTGLPTHDPTNSFKAYRADFLADTPIRSEAGFTLSMELTVKAHFKGRRVEQVPSTWRDRTAGESRFRLARWLPLYLKWYVWALRARWVGVPD